jgi:hypothetical protein
MKKHLALLVAVVGLSTTHGSAQLVLGQTYNSGYSGATKLAAGAADTDFKLVSVPSGQTTGVNPVVPTSTPVGYWYTSSTAQFISPTPGQGPSSNPYGDLPGYYDYQTILTTNFMVPTFVNIAGSVLSDNTVDIKVDGSVIFTGPSSPNSEYAGPPNPFTDTLSIAAGVQSTTIDFVVENYNANNSVPPVSNGGTSATGLLVSGLKATVAPEPSTWLLLGCGLVSLLLIQRVRRAENV